MVSPITFNIPGQPQGFRVKKQGREQASLKAEARKQYEGKPIKGPLQMEIDFYVYPPKGLISRVKAGQTIYPLRQPGQVDSMAHLVQKYLQHVAYRDPAQVVEMRTRKVYDLNPRTEISLSKI